jgi:two-component system LytT family response regulator
MIRTLIVDDEPPARGRIRKLLGVDPELEVIGECGLGEDAVMALQRDPPDLIFLDIRLPDMTGFDVLERAGVETSPLVVFVTAYDEHAVRAFGVRAVDYLVKPFERAQLYAAVGRVKRQLQMRTALAESGRPPLRAVSRTPGGRIAVRTEGRVVRLRLDEIERIEADRDTACFYLRGGTTLVAHEGLSTVERRLPESLFLRVHRSHIVNLARVREVHPWFQGESLLILDDGSKVVTGRTYRDKIQVLLK